jgi:hypothetical protein
MRDSLWLACLICFSFLMNGCTTASAQDQPLPLTAREVVQRIHEHVGVPWQEETVDTFKAGDPDTRITGIAVTMMATFDVLQRATSSGANLIITHEPTFYNHLDVFTEIPQKENDPVLAEKLAFIKEHHLVVWRFHDHWHSRAPDGIEAGMTHALAWEAFQDKQNLSPGSAGMQREIGALETPDIQLLITGESREWETVEYAADAVSERKNKALIILGHIPSEQAGMEECTRWLKTFVSEVPVNFVPAAQPFW